MLVVLSVDGGVFWWFKIKYLFTKILTFRIWNFIIFKLFFIAKFVIEFVFQAVT